MSRILSEPRKFFSGLPDIVLLVGLVMLLNLFWPDDPGFLFWYGTPYVVPALVVTLFRRTLVAVLTLVIGLLAGFVVMPLLTNNFTLAYWRHLVDVFRASGIPLAFLFVAELFFQIQQKNQRSSLLGRLKRQVKQSSRLKRKADSLERVNRVLEERLVAQIDSITLLRGNLKKLATFNLPQALEGILEMLTIFTEMSAGSIWTHQKETGKLLPVAVRGERVSAIPPEGLDMDQTIAGYVFRNGRPFSLRMLLHDQEFTGLATMDFLMIYPLHAHGNVWGLIVIERLPFERYSYYTESILEIIISLVEPYLSDILEYEQLYQGQEVDQITQLPLVTQLVKNLDSTAIKDLRTAPLALIVLEIVNFEGLAQRWDREKLKKLFLVMREKWEEALEMKVKIFHYKEENQLALLVPGLDQDGVSFFCLRLLTLIQEADLSLEGEVVPLEVIVGFGLATGPVAPDQLMREAENLLEFQRPV
ncbi:MAG: GAF domain-containing protein [Spirochaetales bacterium]|nr:GAF domain-containing protein [Spirochaetales bacterium]